MAYVVEETAYNRTEKVLNVSSFAIDLAAALGGQVDPEDTDHHCFRRIVLPGNVRLSVSATHTYGAGDRSKVTLRLSPTDVPSDLWSSFYGERYKLPEISVSTNRPLPQLVKDLKRRLFEPSATPLAAMRELAARREAHRNQLAASADAIEAQFPQLSVRRQNQDSATFYGSEPHVSGHVNADGSLTIERMACVNREQFAAIYRILREGSAA